MSTKIPLACTDWFKGSMRFPSSNTMSVLRCLGFEVLQRSFESLTLDLTINWWIREAERNFFHCRYDEEKHFAETSHWLPRSCPRFLEYRLDMSLLGTMDHLNFYDSSAYTLCHLQDHDSDRVAFQIFPVLFWMTFTGKSNGPIKQLFLNLRQLF